MFYVSTYEKGFAFHPEEGGYFVTTWTLKDYKPFTTLSEARHDLRKEQSFAKEFYPMVELGEDFLAYGGRDDMYLVYIEETLGENAVEDEPYC